MMKSVAMLLLSLIAGMAFAESSDDPLPPSRAPGTVEELAAITQRGRELAAYDQAAWYASDAIQEQFSNATGFANYIAKRNGSDWTVVFGRLNDRADRFLILYEAIQGDNPKKFVVHPCTPPREDNGFYLSAAKCLTLAESIFVGERRPYNMAALPIPGGEFYVYVVPAQREADVYPLGGDVRYRFSADGSTLLETRRLHRGILEVNLKKQVANFAGGKLETVVHSAVMDDIPEDTDVFHVLARQPAVPEMVMTPHFFVYNIDTDGSISFDQKQSDAIRQRAQNAEGATAEPDADPSATQPLRQPLPSTPDQDARISRGVSLHNKGKYDEAITLYLSVLKENPSNVAALYEIAFTLWTKKDYEKSIYYAKTLLTYESKNRSLLLGLLGNVLDDQGNHDQAIATYLQALELEPKSYLLHYNLGATYARMNDVKNAAEQLQTTLSINPTHPNSYRTFSQVYRQEGQTIPRLLSLVLYLVFEVKAPQIQEVLQELDSLLEKSADDKVPDNRESLDQFSLEIGAQVVVALGDPKVDPARTFIERRVTQFDFLFSALAKMAAEHPHTSYFWKHYAPYFIQLEKKGYTEDFTYWIYGQSKRSEVTNWLEANKSRLYEYLNWTRDFSWE